MIGYVQHSALLSLRHPEEYLTNATINIQLGRENPAGLANDYLDTRWRFGTLASLEPSGKDIQVWEHLGEPVFAHHNSDAAFPDCRFETVPYTGTSAHTLDNTRVCLIKSYRDDTENGGGGRPLTDLGNGLPYLPGV
jgi:hypothetical protein